MEIFVQQKQTYANVTHESGHGEWFICWLKEKKERDSERMKILRIKMKRKWYSNFS